MDVATNVQVQDMPVQKRNVAVSVASIVAGVGMAVPDRVVSNDYFASYLETSDSWIRERTGIVERRWAAPETATSELAEQASRQALISARLQPQDIDGIIVATTTPDHLFPSTACVLQRRLGCPIGMAFDVNAVCSGFIYALTTADALIASGQFRHILVVGADIYSRIINPKDRSTCILFGDGAGAIVLSSLKGSAKANGIGAQPQRMVGNGYELRGIYASELRADGSGAEILHCRGGSAHPATAESLARDEHYIVMNGREVFKQAVRALVEVSESLLVKTGLSVDDVDYFVSHQANKRILTAMGKQLGVEGSKILCNVDRYGNTSAASVPILLAEAAMSGQIKQGDLILLSAFGGGVTWGAVLLRW